MEHLKNGDLMTVEEFIRHVEYGTFIPYDGWGRYSNGTLESNVYVSFNKEQILKDTAGKFTHVIWYNK